MRNNSCPVSVFRTCHSRDELMSALDYDPLTGVFRWKISPSKHRKAGSVAGLSSNDGYDKIGYRGQRYFAHRLAWLFMTGDWPPCVIDHKDLNIRNNAFYNLRCASFSQNVANQKPRSIYGKGVYYEKDRNKFVALISCRGKRYNLGRFGTKGEAAEAYNVAAKRLFGEFARVS